jgi:hypothetical protein
VTSRVLEARPGAGLHPLRPALEAGGLFLYEAASVLAVLLAGLALLQLLVEPRLLPGPGPGVGAAIERGLYIVASVGFVVVAALGVCVRLTPRLELYLVGLFLVLVARLGAATIVLPNLPRRARSWLAMLMLAVACHVAWMGVVAVDDALPFDARALARVLLSLGEALAVTVAAVSPGAFWPRGVRPHLPLATGLVVAATAAALSIADWPTAARVAAYGFGLELPMELPAVALCAVALGSLAATTAALLLAGGAARLRGIGLALLGAAGYQLEFPGQLAASLLGLLCIADSYLREADGALAPEAWRAALQRLAAAVGAVEVRTVGAAGYESARMHARTTSAAVVVTLGRRAGMAARLEVAVGDPPEREPPPLSLWRRGTPRLGRRAGTEVPTGDAPFDACLAVRDARTLHAGDPVLSDALRPRLASAVDGWLGVWPGRGAIFRSVEPRLLARAATEPAAIAALVEVMVQAAA